MSKICLIGPITKDTIIHDGHVLAKRAGGSVYYAARTLSSYSQKCHVLTTCAAQDEDYFKGQFDADFSRAQFIRSAATLNFENSTVSISPEISSRRVFSVSDERIFSCDQLLSQSYTWIHLAPLLNTDFDVDFVRGCRSRARIVSLDGQGLLRSLQGADVFFSRPRFIAQMLRLIDVVKFNEEEACFITRSRNYRQAAEVILRFGVKEVIITLGQRGSFFCTRETRFDVNACHIVPCLDTTGCGDTFMAAFLSSRLRGKTDRDSVIFASRAASFRIYDNNKKITT